MRRILAGLALTLLVATPVSADHTGIGWRTGDIRVTTNVLGTPLEAMFRQAVEAWDASPHITLTVGEAKQGSVRFNGTTYPCAKQRNVVVVCAAGTQQFAMLDYQGGYLRGVFIGIPPLLADAFVCFVCHEVGHGLGLRHTADHDSCMYSWETDGVGGPQTTHPSAHDFEALAAIYP